MALNSKNFPGETRVGAGRNRSPGTPDQKLENISANILQYVSPRSPVHQFYSNPRKFRLCLDIFPYFSFDGRIFTSFLPLRGNFGNKNEGLETPWRPE